MLLLLKPLPQVIQLLLKQLLMQPKASSNKLKISLPKLKEYSQLCKVS
jgi:hypothetical protein